MTTTITIEGIEELKAKLKSVGITYTKETDKILTESALQIEEMAKLSAPVDTGYLRSMIVSDVTGFMEKIIHAQAEYSIYVEFGTSRMVAQPFMIPAVEFVVPFMIENLKNIENQI